MAIIKPYNLNVKIKPKKGGKLVKETAYVFAKEIASYLFGGTRHVNELGDFLGGRLPGIDTVDATIEIKDIDTAKKIIDVADISKREFIYPNNPLEIKLTYKGGSEDYITPSIGGGFNVHYGYKR